MYKNKKIALVIPAYNEEKLIKPTLEHVPPAIDHVYVIDDCSTDNMASVVEEIAKKDKRIEKRKVIRPTHPQILNKKSNHSFVISQLFASSVLCHSIHFHQERDEKHN